jgi:ribosomal protein L22
MTDSPEEKRAADAGAPSEDAPGAETAARVSGADAPSEVTPDELDIQGQEAAEDVMLEADDEAEGESTLVGTDDAEDEVVEAAAPEPAAEDAEEAAEAEAEAPAKPARRRRRGGKAGAAAGPEKPSAPAPSRRRSRERPAGPPPVVRAQAKYVRSSARKARLVCDHIRGKTVEEARAILAHTPRAVARDWSKLLESAVANAEHNHELVGEDLYVKAVQADEGPTIKRFRPRAMGRATRIRKRTSHLTILLTPKD